MRAVRHLLGKATGTEFGSSQPCPPAVCRPAINAAGLSDGQHTLKVTVEDAARDPHPSRAWRETARDHIACADASCSPSPARCCEREACTRCSCGNDPSDCMDARAGARPSLAPRRDTSRAPLLTFGPLLSRRAPARAASGGRPAAHTSAERACREHGGLDGTDGARKTASPGRRFRVGPNRGATPRP